MPILDNSKDIFINTKNSSIAILARKFINNQIKEFGSVEKLQIDSQKKDISLDVFLKGEKEKIHIKIENYGVVQKDNSAFIKFKNVSASREWIEALIQSFVNRAPNKMIKINSLYAKIIDLLI